MLPGEPIRSQGLHIPVLQSTYSPTYRAHFDTDPSSETSPCFAGKFDLYPGGRPPSWYDNDVKSLAAIAPGSPTEPALRVFLNLRLIWDKEQQIVLIDLIVRRDRGT